MSNPSIAQKAPFPVQVEGGKSYFWCACGSYSGISGPCEIAATHTRRCRTTPR